MAPPIVFSGHRESKNCSRRGSLKMMGKARKLNAGDPTRLVSDYQHPIETTAESEGFGSSGRVDTEMTVSEDSCSPKRKCISLNGDYHDRFGIPVQVLSVSKMSKSERKELELRLKGELEEVRILQKRVASFNTNSVDLSPLSDIRSCSDGLKRPLLECNQRLPEHATQGKKRLPPGRTIPRAKKGLPGHIESPKVAVPMSTSMASLMKQCEKVLSQLMTHQYGWVFNTPVDVVKLNIPDYFTVIKHPMDLGTVKSKLARGEYSNPLGFSADVRLTFANAMTYNPRGNDVHIMAQTLNKQFEQKWKSIVKKIPSDRDTQCLPLRMEAQLNNEATTDLPVTKKMVQPVGYSKLEPVEKVMTNEEKQNMSMELEALLSELPENIIDFLKENSFGAEQTSEDEIEIDIDALRDDVLFKLRNLLDDFILKKKQSKVEACEMELHNVSGFSNSSIQPGKGNDVADEDVDIGGNDHLVSSFQPVETQKNTSNIDSRCKSPSSSSSDSGSSSSDTELGSSPGSQLRGNKVQQQVMLQVNVGAEPNMKQNQSNVDQNVGRSQSLNRLSQVDENPQSEPSSVTFDGNKEGQNAPSDRQVSSDKLYRAALLRSRFADTILKAQEKTLEKGEKRDPDKLRLEREELERRQREEKARLQAEAKAAEVARQKAEAEAAAEAKRKRELEREAARLALQKMEKTVDINENCRFLEDLEMLSTAPPEDLSNFMDDAISNDCLNDRLGSFRLRGNSNPLEQLGLYMKDDYEEEEEVDVPQSAPDPAANNDKNDVEEGEID